MKFFLLVLALVGLATFRSAAQDTCAVTIPYGSNPKAGGFAPVNGIKMYYEIYGNPSRPPLLLIHGNGGSVWSMRCQIEHFKKDYRIIIADSRYHGKSDNGNKELTYELMAADYSALLDHLKLDSVYAIGQSDGGILVLLLALNHPGKLKKAVAMAPNLRPDTTALVGYFVRKVSHDLDSLNQQVRAGSRDAAWVRRKVHLELMARYPNVPTTALGKIQIPIMIMLGDADVITLEHIIEMYRALPKAHLLVMSGTTHRMLREEYRLFNQMTERFLKEEFKRPMTTY